MVILHETHGQRDTAPEEGDEGQMATGADVTNENCRRRLEDDVCNEEDEICNILFTFISLIGC